MAATNTNNVGANAVRTNERRQPRFFELGIEVIILQIPGISSDTANSMATVFPAITGAVLTIQLKLSWAEKSAKCKKAAKLYKRLVDHAEYRLNIIKAGGRVADTEKMLNTALIAEVTEIPIIETQGLPNCLLCCHRNAKVGPEATDPVKPNTTVPVAPNTTVPVAPNTTVPVEPNTTTPVAPNTTVPVEPNTTTPVAPNTTVPVAPNTTVPVEPNTTVPVAPN